MSLLSVTLRAPAVMFALYLKEACLEVSMQSVLYTA